MKQRRGWIAWAVIAAAAVVILGSLLADAHRKASDEDDEEISSTPPTVQRGPGGEMVVRLTAAEQAKAGLETQALRPMSRSPEVAAYGVILDPAPLIALNSELASVSASLSTSRAEYERAKLLHAHGQNVSLKSVQAAESKFRADQAQFNQFNQQLANKWGRAMAHLKPARRNEIVARLARRAIAIARVSLPTGQTLVAKPRDARVVVLGYEKHPLTTPLVSFAPSVDPSLQGESFLLELDASKFPLVPGAAVTAYLRSAAPPEEGVILPRSAVVRFNNAAWVYVRLDANDFARREVSLTVPLAHGWFLPDSLSPGTRVVVTGAQTLLSDELGASHRVDED
jgi:hypothetical protein